MKLVFFKKKLCIYGTADKCTILLLGPMEKLRQRGIEEHVPLDYQTQLKPAYLDGNICL